MPIPASLADLLPSRPVLSSFGGGSSDVLLERYHHPPGAIAVPGLTNTLLVMHMRGPVAVEEKSERSGWVRRWTDMGQASVTPAGTPVARRFVGRPEILLIQISPRLLDEVIVEAIDVDPGSVKVLPSFARHDPMLDRYGRLLEEEIAHPSGPGHQLAQDLLGKAIALTLLRRYSTLDPGPPDRLVRIAPARIQRVIDVMHEETERNPTLADLAALSGLSATHFARAFRSTTGSPPHRYLMALRMARARRLLVETDLPVGDVAARCGFEQAGSFATAFRKAVGVTPREWRLERRA